MSFPDPRKVRRISKIVERAMRRPLLDRKKIATGKTVKSIIVRERAGETFVTWEVLAGAGYQFIQFGKRAGTKLPVRKVGDRFELVPELKEWKRVRGVKIPDYVLARSIARKARPGVDLIGDGLRNLEKEGLDDMILDLMEEDVIRRITRIL